MYESPEPQAKSLTTFQKYGRTNEATPAKWQAEYKDYNASTESGSAVPASEKKEGSDSVPSAAPNGTSEAMEVDAPEANGEKRRKHEGETPEERAERKRRKKEKKAAKKAAGEKKDASEDDD